MKLGDTRIRGWCMACASCLELLCYAGKGGGMRNLTTECDGWRRYRRDLWVGTSRVQHGGSLLVGCGKSWGHETSLVHRLLDLGRSSWLKKRRIWGGQWGLTRVDLEEDMGTQG